jgi:uncharacterized protein (DUF433 family)
MSTVEELQKAILSLHPAEAANLADWVITTVPRNRQVAPGIDVDPRVCGGSPRVAGTRIPVRTLEEYRRLGATQEDLLRSYPSLRSEDLANAFSYADGHREEIDREILENEMA